MDAAAIGVLLLIGIIVLLGRRAKTAAYLTHIAPIIIYSAYCFLSIAWSPTHLPSFKRWTKDVGDVVMALIVSTDPLALQALRHLFSRLAYILFPLSIYLIYFTTLGRFVGNDGIITNTGITTNKNMLGLVSFVISVGVVWNLRWLLMNKDELNRGLRLVGQSVLLVLGLTLLLMSHSSTSLACFFLGSGLMFATYLPAVKYRPSRVHLLCGLPVLLGMSAYFFGGTGQVANILGRGGDLSGRTDMWAAMFPAVSNPLIGVGFDSFWTSPNAVVFHHNLNALHWYHSERINEAHNGYIETYLNLGWIGVCLIAVILLTGFWRAGKAFQRNAELGSLALAFIISGAIYSITEAGFRTLSPMWIFILLAVVSVSGANARLLGKGNANSGGRSRHRHLNEAEFEAVAEETEVINHFGGQGWPLDQNGWGSSSVRNIGKPACPAPREWVNRIV